MPGGHPQSHAGAGQSGSAPSTRPSQSSSAQLAQNRSVGAHTGQAGSEGSAQFEQSGSETSAKPSQSSSTPLSQNCSGAPAQVLVALATLEGSEDPPAFKARTRYQ